jgi:hypothetical protein
MYDDEKFTIINEPVELGNLLANTIGSVVDAQEKLDAYTERRRQAYESAPQGTMVLPPLWYVFNSVSVEIELSAAVAKVSSAPQGTSVPHLMCRTVNPTTVGLFGRESATVLKIRVDVGPEGYLPIKHTSPVEEFGGDK